MATVHLLGQEISLLKTMWVFVVLLLRLSVWFWSWKCRCQGDGGDNQSQMALCPEGTYKWGPPEWIKRPDSDIRSVRWTCVILTKLKQMQRIKGRLTWASWMRFSLSSVKKKNTPVPLWQKSFWLPICKGNTFNDTGQSLIFHYPKKENKQINTQAQGWWGWGCEKGGAHLPCG